MRYAWRGVRRWLAPCLGSALALAGCESYQPLPLAAGPALAPNLASLRMPVGARLVDGLDLSHPLTVTGLAILAVENNPDLRLLRAERGIAQAELLQAGILPNPQISGSLGAVLAGPGTATGWSVGLTQDIKSLVTLSATRRSTEFNVRRVEADLLWQEWLVIAKARLLFVDSIEQARLGRLLRENRQLFADRYARSRRAVSEGNLPLSTAAPDITALSDLDRLIADFDRQAAQRQRDLDGLLGLSPDVVLDLAPDIAIPEIDGAAIAQLLPRLPELRPDLLALQLGYQAEEQKVRAAILGQFPALVLGGLGGSDTTAVRSVGPSITLDLPIFNRNQGAIALERATRQRLHTEYTNRLSAAAAEIQGLVAQQILLRRQLAEQRTQLADARTVAENAAAAYDAGNLDERSYVDLAVVVIAKQQQIIAIEQALLEQQVAITSLLGTDMPVAASSAGPSSETMP